MNIPDDDECPLKLELKLNLDECKEGDPDEYYHWNRDEDPYNLAGNVFLHKKFMVLKEFNHLIAKHNDNFNNNNKNKEEEEEDDDDELMDICRRRQEYLRFQKIHSLLTRDYFDRYEMIFKETYSNVQYARCCTDEYKLDYASPMDEEDAVMLLFGWLRNREFAYLVIEGEFQNLVESIKEPQPMPRLLVIERKAKEIAVVQKRLNLINSAGNCNMELLKIYNDVMEKEMVEYVEHDDKLQKPKCVSRLDRDKCYAYKPPPGVMVGVNVPPQDLRIIKLMVRECLQFPKIYAGFLARLQHYVLLGRCAYASLIKEEEEEEEERLEAPPRGVHSTILDQYLDEEIGESSCECDAAEGEVECGELVLKLKSVLEGLDYRKPSVQQFIVNMMQQSANL